MVELASSYGHGPVSLNAVAAAQRIPLGYLEHIAQDLKRAGLLTSQRGTAGGYQLTAAPESISVADILRGLEGAVLPIDCGDEESCAFHDQLAGCATRPLWQQLQRQVEESLAKVTLASVAKQVTGAGTPIG